MEVKENIVEVRHELGSVYFTSWPPNDVSIIILFKMKHNRESHVIKMIGNYTLGPEGDVDTWGHR